MSTASSPILSMGEILIDFIVSDNGMSLESARAFSARAGGAPANVAVALARLGLSSAFCGVVGQDPFGMRLTAELEAEGVDATRLRRSGDAPTALAFAWKDSRGDGHFWLNRGADTLLSPADAECAGIPSCAALVAGSVSLAVEPSCSAIMRGVALAVSAGTPVVFDVNLRPAVWSDLELAARRCAQLMGKCRLVKLSLDDARGLYGTDTSPEAAMQHVRTSGAEAVVLTDGDRGCWFTGDSETITFVSAFAVEAIEPTGAGDAFLAALIARLLASRWAPLTLEDVRVAAAAGALATTKPGAWDGLPDRAQLDAFLRSA